MGRTVILRYLAASGYNVLSLFGTSLAPRVVDKYPLVVRFEAKSIEKLSIEVGLIHNYSGKSRSAQGFLLQEGILEDGGTVFLFDGLPIPYIIGELCADIWKFPNIREW